MAREVEMAVITATTIVKSPTSPLTNSVLSDLFRTSWRGTSATKAALILRSQVENPSTERPS